MKYSKYIGIFTTDTYFPSSIKYEIKILLILHFVNVITTNRWPIEMKYRRIICAMHLSSSGSLNLSIPCDRLLTAGYLISNHSNYLANISSISVKSYSDLN